MHRPFIPAWNLPEAGKQLAFLATILDTADERHARAGERPYDQMDFAHPCGTPSCALGHLRFAYSRSAVLTPVTFEASWAQHLKAKNFIDWDMIFGAYGCNGAKTAQQAADYIRFYVELSWGVVLPTPATRPVSGWAFDLVATDYGRG
jgi:hypothetical protein